MGDIGQHFPPSDPAYAGISSLLGKTAALAAAGYRVVNLDATIIAQAPKLALIPRCASDCARPRIEAAAVSVKATTEEKLGFTGRGEGIAAQAVVLLEKA
ncbi:MAG: 2-C-methyl-D-erythritol 2,4-cyclodiphosphate synthase [Acutalibacteraceae bacterium]